MGNLRIAFREEVGRLGRFRMIAASMLNEFRPLEGFSYARGDLADRVDYAVARALTLGASDVSAEASEGMALTVNVRCGELETVEHSRDKGLEITVYMGQRSGSADTSDLSDEAIAQTVRAACDIARCTGEDPAAGLPDSTAVETAPREDLELFHSWPLTVEEACAIASACEQAAFDVDARVDNSEGATVFTEQSHFFAAHTHGFRGGYAGSQHGISVAPVVRGADGEMQRDDWSSTRRRATDLAAPDAIGRYAAERALSRLGARRLATRSCPVLFEAPLAAGLLGDLAYAMSGGLLYRQASFLQDAMGKRVLPDFIDVVDDPFVPRGNASSPFDDEGVRVQARKVIEGGRVQGYFLDSYSARKLAMQTTGNAGGTHNLSLHSRQTRPGDDLDAMLRQMDTGLLVTELLGDGVDYLTGDYSRGASGYWVEHGCIAYPVQEITIAGNLRDMLQDIQAVGADAYVRGAKTSGSVLIARMKVAGG